MKSAYTFSKMVIVLVVMVAVVLVALAIFGVFSEDTLKNSLGKIAELGGVVIVASVVITALTGHK